jgi:beta-glucosidase
VQRRLVEAVIATGTPVVMVLLTGRPYAIGWALDGADAAPGAVLQAFFPGEGGGLAIADIITGRVNPSGRLPVSMPRSAGAQPYSYLHPALGGPSDVTATDSTPLRPFGFGLSYASFDYSDLVVDPDSTAGGNFTAAVTVTNTGAVRGVDTVQLYGHDVHGIVTRPVAQLLGYARVELDPEDSVRLTFSVPTTRFAFSDRRMIKVVEPGDVEVWVASHAAASVGTLAEEVTSGAIVSEKLTKVRHVPGVSTARATVVITGEVHEVTLSDPRMVTVRQDALARSTALAF